MLTLGPSVTLNFYAVALLFPRLLGETHVPDELFESGI